MNIKSFKKEGKTCRFLLEGADYAFANSLRRAILSEVPTMAVDKMTVYSNTSPLYDEFLSKRFALVPLTTDLKTYSPMEECKCKGKGCARCTVTLTVEKKGPGTLYASDMKSKDPKTKPVYEKMPIAKLAEGEIIKLELRARLGKGAEYARFQSGIASYKQIDDNKFEFFIESFNERDPTELLELAFAELKTKVDDFEKNLKGGKASK